MPRTYIQTVGSIIAFLWFLPLGLPALGQESVSAAELSRFAALARTVVEKPITETPSPQMSEALDILLSASERVCRHSPAVTDDQLVKRLAPFRQKLDPDKKATGQMDPGWFDVSTGRQGSVVAVAVTMGAVSRLKVYDTASDQALPVAAPMQWLYRYHQHVQFTAAGNLLVISDSIQDAGVREGLRIDLLKQAGHGYVIQQTLKRLFVLEMPGPQLTGDRLIINSVDTPRAFFTSQSDTHFGRIETYAVQPGRLRLLRDQKRDPELRFIDEWMLAAKRTEKPSALQSLVRRELSKASMFSDSTVKSMDARTQQVTVAFDEAKLRFILQKGADGYRVVSVQRVTP